MAEEVLEITSVTDPKTQASFVRESYGEIATIFTATEARMRGQGIFSAAGIAAACGSMMHLMVFADDNKGFGKPSLPECERKTKEAVKFVNLVYRGLEEFPPGIAIGYGLKIDKQEIHPYVMLHWGDDPIEGQAPEHYVKLLLPEAKNHATWLMACAEAVETDNFLHYFYQQKLGLSFEQVQQLLSELAAFRQRDVKK
jgi:hypothetical protein